MFLQWALFCFNPWWSSLLFVFIFGCAGVFVAAWGLSLVGASRGYSLLFVEACGVFLLCGFSSCRAPRLSSCGAWAWSACPLESSWSGDRICVPCIGRQRLHHWTTRKVHQWTLSAAAVPSSPFSCIKNKTKQLFFFFFSRPGGSSRILCPELKFFGVPK